MLNFSWLVLVSAGLFGFQLARLGFSWLVRVSAGSLLCLAPLVVVHSFTDGIIPVQLAIACTHACPTFVVKLSIPYSRLFWRALKLANWSKMLLANFNLANMCVPHAYARKLACLAELILAI